MLPATKAVTIHWDSGFGGLEVACWPLVPKFTGSNPAEAVGFFRAKKILSTPSFGREGKTFVPCRRFTACKRSLNVTWKSGIFRQNSSAISRPSNSSFHYWGLWWRHLAVQVGTTKDQGLYNKPSAAVHPGALAAGILPQYNTIHWDPCLPIPARPVQRNILYFRISTNITEKVQTAKAVAM